MDMTHHRPLVLDHLLDPAHQQHLAHTWGALLVATEADEVRPDPGIYHELRHGHGQAARQTEVMSDLADAMDTLGRRMLRDTA